VCRPGRTCTLLNTYIQYLVSCHRVQGGVRYVMCTHRVGRGGRHDTLGHARMPRPAGIPVAAALAVRPRPTACRCSPTTYACIALTGPPSRSHQSLLHAQITCLPPGFCSCDSTSPLNISTDALLPNCKSF